MNNRILLQAGVLMTLAVGCNNSPQVFFSTATDKFTAHLSDNYTQASQLLQADYVFTLDYSSSMSQNGGNSSKIQIFLDSMSGFTSALENQGIDYKIGIINGNVHANNEDEISTSFLSEALTRETTGTLYNSILDQVSPAGLPLAQNTNYLLESVKRTITNKGSEFFRDGSQAVYVFLSDSDDRSHQNNNITGNKTPEAYASFLRNSRSHFSYVSARAIVAGVGSTCSLQNEYDIAGIRIAETVRQSDARAAEANCIYVPFEESLANLARNVTRPTNRFTLRGSPVPSSVRVIENGVEIEKSRWSYRAASNEVIFKDGQEPALSASLEIIYSQLFELSNTPKVDTLSITINGTALESSDFEYIASENRIEFLGSSKPVEGDDIRISYQAQ
jgi:hypothetical protein